MSWAFNDGFETSIQEKEQPFNCTLVKKGSGVFFLLSNRNRTPMKNGIELWDDRTRKQF